MAYPPHPSVVTSAQVAVVICAFDTCRWDSLVRAVNSAGAQSMAAAEVVIVIDHNAGLFKLASERFDAATVIENAHSRGLSGARNSAIERITASYTAFLDDDAVADPGWLAELVGALHSENVVGVGGDVRPTWLEHRPAWFPDEFAWVVGCAHNGMPTRRAPVRNAIGANMAFPSKVLRDLGGFREGIGRVGSVPLGCEETELCIRAQKANPGAVVLYEPSARVAHAVPPERATLRYFLARCRAEGRSKALVARLVGTGDGLASERSYVRRTLPRGIVKGVGDALGGKPAGLVRAGAILLGLTATTVGYVKGRLSRQRL